MVSAQSSKTLPSSRWTSLDSWDYNGMQERLQTLLFKLDKSVLLRHAESVTGQRLTMSEPFSAGQYWICFELVAEDGSLVIARVRLPRHPDLPSTVTEKDELYSISCEVSTMQFVSRNPPTVTIPRVYAYEGPGSQLAADAGAIYMLLEGFYGNTLQDVAFDICSLPVATQEHIMAQWATVQAELATLTHSQIGTICSASEQGEPVIGKLSSAAAEGLSNLGPFSSAVDYFTAIAEAALHKPHPSTNGHSNKDWTSLARLGALVLLDIIQTTQLFTSSPDAQFPLNHMDLGTQNILVDDAFNFLAVIDWKFAQTAPWQVNYYPMPFPLIWSGEKIKEALENPEHLAHKNVSRQVAARGVYVEKFREAEDKLRREGRPMVGGSFADVLESAASRVYGCFCRLRGVPEQDEELVWEMVRVAFEFGDGGMEEYLGAMKGRLRETGGLNGVE
ncbi:hypothetical protein C8A01DRAFT_48310 [Parachaetomium inaequale]|uniref:Aminoglycoside phosphotransferase domain-containing protein n=1 Tax=Parachaetomium inaequale TaxID=2588326 RepID=A0AAN6SQ37_9PEZI|nr:hypothetical protein C8A01DRAFT_48310 [Parachaetomium inaequale]